LEVSGIRRQPRLTLFVPARADTHILVRELNALELAKSKG
jgi:hypothetical protein